MGSQCSIPSTNAVGNETNATNCSENVIEGLNLTNMCNRDTFDAVIMFIMYILVIAIGMISNASVILASIFERYVKLLELRQEVLPLFMCAVVTLLRSIRLLQ